MNRECPDCRFHNCAFGCFGAFALGVLITPMSKLGFGPPWDMLAALVIGVASAVGYWLWARARDRRKIAP